MRRVSAVSAFWCNRIGPPRFVRLRLLVSPALLALGILAAGGKASAANIGPSFPCSPAPTDALTKLACSDPTLALADIRMVQTYYALRQFVGLEKQKPLKSELLSFMVSTRGSCGLPPVEPKRDQSADSLPLTAASCVAAAYDAERIAMARRLSGPAVEEAARAPDRNIALQAKLQSLGYLPKDATIDDVFGIGTRVAIMAWQNATGRPATYFLSNADAAVLLGDASPSAPVDPLAKLRGKPFANADYRGQPLALEYKNLQVSVEAEKSQAPEVCGTPNGGILSLGSAQDTKSCRAVIAKVTVDGKEAARAQLALLDADEDAEKLAIKVAIRRLDNATALPQVVISGYSGGAHCCTTTAVATAGSDGTWKFVSLGGIDGDGGFSFLDLDHNGSSVLVAVDETFNYEFASYAGSVDPTLIRRFADGALHGATKEPQYRGFLLEELRTMEREDASGSERNGYLAGWIAQKALVGQFEEGWPAVVRSYDRHSTLGLDGCAVDKSVWTKNQYGSLDCPEGQQVQRTFPEALALQLADLGYVTPEQITKVGFDLASVEAQRTKATALYAQRMADGWFVITNAGNCALSSRVQSPADMITGDRARGLEDIVNVLESGDDGKPVAVRVGEPEANGLLSTMTFYRGAAKCESTRQSQKNQLDNLR